MVAEKKPVVFLINAPSNHAVYKEDRCQIDANELLAKFFRPPISLMLLAGIVEAAGHEARILDCPVQGYSFQHLKSLLLETRPSMVVINTSEQTEHEDFLTARMAKRAGARTIAFGYLATVLKKAFLSRCPWVDITIMKEPEMALRDVLEGKKMEEIGGICYIDDARQVKENQDRPFMANLDDLPYSSHHLIDFKKYRYPFTGKPFTVIQVSRGCPFGCKFCLAPFLNGTTVREKSVAKVLGEIQHVARNLHVSTFFLRADTFTLHKEWIRQFCNGIIETGLRVQWFTNSRIDTIPEELAPLMRAAGCMIIGIGIESGVPAHQRLLNKNINLSVINRKLRALNAAGIQSVIYFMIGQPFDTTDTIIYNIHYSKTIPATFVEYTRYVDLRAVDLGHDAIRFPAGYLKMIARKGEVLFYFRLRKMLEILSIVEGNIIRNPFYFPHLVVICARALGRFLHR